MDNGQSLIGDDELTGALIGAHGLDDLADPVQAEVRMLREFVSHLHSVLCTVSVDCDLDHVE